MIRGKRILITGGAGFIGTTLAARLVPDNELVVFDNLHRNAIQSTNLLDSPQVTLFKGDVMDAALVKKAMEGCQLVLHMASIAGVDTVIKHPVTTMKVSLIGTYNVLEAAQAMGSSIERVVDFSTSEVFGQFAYKVSEGDVTSLGAVGEARWTYAVSKLATEHLAFNYHKQFGLPTVAIRPFNIFGPRQVGEGAIHHFIVRAIRNEPLSIHNDGSQIRSWCYVDDIVEGILLTMERPEAVGQAFNIGNPRNTLTIYSLAKEVIRLAGSQSTIEFTKKTYPDVELRIPNVDKALNLLGFEAQVDLEEGLKRTIDWYRSKDRGDK